MAAAVAWGAAQALFPDGPRETLITEPVRRGRIVKTVVTVGEVASAMLVNVGAQVGGRIERLHVAPGMAVKAGDLIAEIDSTTQANNLVSERARLETYEAQLVSREIALRTAQAKFDRESRLKRSDATSEESLEAAEQALAAAKASLAETRSMISQSRTAVSTAETNLAYTRITSPLDGTVVSVPVRQGQTVNANQSTPTIAQIADLGLMEIRMQISEGDVTKVRPGMEVTWTILSEPDRRFSGILESVDPGLTTVSDGSYSGATDAGTAVYYYAKVMAGNADGTLRIGMTTQNVIIVGESADALMVPTAALYDVRVAGSDAARQGAGRGGGEGVRPRSGRGRPRGVGGRPAGPGPAEGSADGPAPGSADGSPDADGAPEGAGAGDPEGTPIAPYEADRSGGSEADRPGGPEGDAAAPPGNGPGAEGGGAAGPGGPERGGSGRRPGGAGGDERRQSGGTEAKILVMEGDQVVERVVSIGLSDDMSTEILAGLSEDDVVVTARLTGAEIERRAAAAAQGGFRGGSGGGPGGGRAGGSFRGGV
jgi:macrolide-specific efflux system membrane fusion protein